MDDRPPEAQAAKPPALTVSHYLGEITWLLSQSPLHRTLAIRDLEWLVMPPLLHRQFYVFRDGEAPVGVALWARCSAEVEAKLEGGIASPEFRLSPVDWISGDALWLVDLVAPFATVDNRQREIMIGDLISGPLANEALKLHLTDPTTGTRSVQTISADAGARLKKAIEEAIASGPRD